LNDAAAQHGDLGRRIHDGEIDRGLQWSNGPVVKRVEEARVAHLYDRSFALPAHGDRWFSSLTDAPVTYFEVIEPTGGRTGKPPMFLIHGRGARGAGLLGRRVRPHGGLLFDDG